jgi:hypothetical protein
MRLGRGVETGRHQGGLLSYGLRRKNHMVRHSMLWFCLNLTGVVVLVVIVVLERLT